MSDAQPKNSKAIIKFLSVLIILVLLGFAGYYFGFLGFVYKVMLPQALGNFSLIILGVIFGTAAFFSPCSFTVLPAYVSHYLTTEPEKEKNLVRAFYLGILAALGVLTINIILGLIVAALGSAAPFAKDPRQDVAIILAIRTIAGLIIAYLGILTFLGKSLALGFIERLVGKFSVKKSMFLYGLLYNGAAIGCTGPILLGLIVYALTIGNAVVAFGAFLVFGLTMAGLMIALTVLTAIFKVAVIKRIMPYTPLIRKFAGLVMIMVGLAITLLTLQGNRLFVQIFFPFLR